MAKLNYYKSLPTLGLKQMLDFFFVTSIPTLPNILYDPWETFEMCRNFFCW